MTKTEIAKLYLELVYQNDHNNSVFDCYNEFKKTSLKDCTSNLNKVLNDNKFINYYVGVVDQYNDWDNIIEEIKIYGG